jgi:MoaA/NifB/PqqE/SkfB family radical SAM enzyme
MLFIAQKMASLWTAKLMDDLCNSSKNNTGKYNYFQLIDRKKRELYFAIAAVYGRGAFSKLLTLKIVNLAVARYHYLHRHSIVASRPLQLMIDPSNSCQLHCPCCVHTSNSAWRRDCEKHWPAGNLPNNKYEDIIKAYAPFAFAVYLYNYGEPFLNKNVFEYIRKAVRYGTYVTVSSNMSLAKFDAEALVESGLNSLIMSIDGATQSAYVRYRRGGDMDMVLENVNKVVAAKKRLRSNFPLLVWQFLTFKHNIHEVDLALERARGMGVDVFHILTPFDVSGDDPSICAARSDKEGYTFFSDPVLQHSSLTENRKYMVGEAEFAQQWDESWLQRMEQLGGMEEKGDSVANRCGWLYKNITMDALGRIMPCCTAPGGARRLVYGNISEERDWFNLPDMQLSRRRGSGHAADLIEEANQPPYCMKCPLSIEPPHDLWRIKQDLPYIDDRGILNQDSLKSLTVWQ